MKNDEVRTCCSSVSGAWGAQRLRGSGRQAIRLHDRAWLQALGAAEPPIGSERGGDAPAGSRQPAGGGTSSSGTSSGGLEAAGGGQRFGGRLQCHIRLLTCLLLPLLLQGEIVDLYIPRKWCAPLPGLGGSNGSRQRTCRLGGAAALAGRQLAATLPAPVAQRVTAAAGVAALLRLLARLRPTWHAQGRPLTLAALFALCASAARGPTS